MTTHSLAPKATASFIAAVAAVLVAGLLAADRADAASRSADPVLAEGAGMGAKPSARVRQVQRALHRRGYDLGPPGVDGRFGPLTAAAVQRLQAARDLVVDGIVGSRTRAALGLRRRAASPRGTADVPRSPSRSTSTPSPAPAPASAAPAPPPAAQPIRLDGDEPVTAHALFWGVVAVLFTIPLVLVLALAAWTRPRRARRERMIGYLATRTQEWSEEHDRSLDALEAVCEESSWELLEVVWDRENGGGVIDRSGLGHALQRIAGGQAKGLVVHDLQSLGRSPQELPVLMAWFQEADATLVALDDRNDPRARAPV
jgi:hypothetical protein